MAEERLKQFYEDRKAMVDILSKHGLLLGKSPASFDMTAVP